MTSTYYAPTTASIIGGSLTPAIATSPYTSDVFDRLSDGSYKEYLSIFSPKTPLTPVLVEAKERPQSFEDSPYQSSLKLIKEFKEKTNKVESFRRHELDKAVKKAVYSYDKLWLVSRELKAKNNTSINGEYIFMKLQIKQMMIAKLNLAIRLHDYYYARVVDIVAEYEDPFNDIPTVKRRILARMPPIFCEFHDTLLKIQYLDGEITKLMRMTESKNPEERHHFRFWLWCKWKGIE